MAKVHNTYVGKVHNDFKFMAKDYDTNQEYQVFYVNAREDIRVLLPDTYPNYETASEFVQRKHRECNLNPNRADRWVVIRKGMFNKHFKKEK